MAFSETFSRDGQIVLVLADRKDVPAFEVKEVWQTPKVATSDSSVPRREYRVGTTTAVNRSVL